MGLNPVNNRSREISFRNCSKCGQLTPISGFSKTNSIFYDGRLPMCNSCIDSFLKEHDYSWEAVDKLCQCGDIPFIPREWEKVKSLNPSNTFAAYSEIFLKREYEGINWKDYYEEFLRLKQNGRIENELPLLDEENRLKLKRIWGYNYDDEALSYLENLYTGLITTQNVNGSLSVDQARKICKISYEIDSRIREGTDFDKLLNSYDKMIKAAEFTPKNVKNINDFDSIGELVKWMERKGWRNRFFDGVTRDIVDETIKNIQNFNQRLYTNETGIGEEITRRLENLKFAEKDKVNNDSYYETNKEYDLDNFDNERYVELFEGESDEFIVDIEEEEEIDF